MKNFLSISLLTIFLFSFSQINYAQTGCLYGNCEDGIGTYYWDSGDSYTGEWRDGSRTGLGCYDWEDGSFYYGYFRDNQLHGEGFYIPSDDDEDIQEGRFEYGALKDDYSLDLEGCILGNCESGMSLYIWESGDYYVGEYKYGKRTGFGRYDWDDGSYYIGYFKEGALDGRGYYYNDENGDEMDGYFVDGDFQGTSNSTPRRAGAASDDD